MHQSPIFNMTAEAGDHHSLSDNFSSRLPLSSTVTCPSYKPSQKFGQYQIILPGVWTNCPKSLHIS